jgi:2-iminoacetate synthase ThiH
MTKQEIVEMITKAGFDPVERDTIYNRMQKVAV